MLFSSYLNDGSIEIPAYIEEQIEIARSTKQSVCAVISDEIEVVVYNYSTLQQALDILSSLESRVHSLKSLTVLPPEENSSISNWVPSIISCSVLTNFAITILLENGKNVRVFPWSRSEVICWRIRMNQF